ncbi:phage tail tape measure protein [Aquabacter sp. CN5-332]|uniref:phage tail tape measure protein n=1 Tax=Aquabacter sp. CN5-332 TaxID=3156608 RepID=UPI0032B42F6B
MPPAREIEARLKISAVDRSAKAFASVERRLSGIHRQTQIMNRHMQQVAAFQKASAATDRAILMSGTALAAIWGASGGVRSGIETLSTFQDGLIAVQKKAGLTEDQMKAVGEEVKALATSPDLAVPIEEILKAYERGAAAGLPLEELREFAALSAKAADAFEMSAEDVGNAAAGFQVGLGIPIKEMEKFFDLINSLADSGISDEKDIINFLDRAGAGLKNFGINAKQAAAYGATLLNLKLAPEVGARMMGALTSKLIAPENLGKKGQSALTEVVGDIKTFKKELKGDANAALIKFLGQLGKLDKFNRARIIGSIFGQEWSDEIMRMVDGVDELQRNLKQAGDESSWLGSLDKSYKLKLASLSSQWQQFKNQVGVLTINVGTASMPALEQGLIRAKELVKEIDEGFKGFAPQLDMKEINAAGQAIDRMLGGMQSLLGMDASESEVKKFFADLATVVNEVAKAIQVVEGSVNAVLHPEAGIQKKTPDQVAQAQAEHAAKQGAEGQSWYEWAQSGMNALGDAIVGENEKPVRRRVPAGAARTGLPGAIDDAALGVTEFHDWMNDVHAGREPWFPAGASFMPPTPPKGASGSWASSGTSGEWQAPPVMPSVNDEALRQAPGSGQRSSLNDEILRSMPQISPPASPVSGPIMVQIEDTSTDALRVAMEAAGTPITVAGQDAGTAIEAAAGRLAEAATRIGEEGQRAADAISSARISVPSMPTAPRAPNANLGQSMPNVGTPGG